MRWRVRAGSPPSRCGREGDAAQAQLQEAVKGRPGGNGSNQHTKSNSAHRAEKQSDPTVASYGKPTDRKSRLIRQRPTS